MEEFLEQLAKTEAISRELDSTAVQEQVITTIDRVTREYCAQNPQAKAWIENPQRNWQPKPLPDQPTKIATVVDEFLNLTEQAGIRPTSGKFFGYVPGGGILTSALGDYMAALTNRYEGVFEACPDAAFLHNQTIHWLCSMMGFDKTAWGTLQSGGSLATLTAFMAARETRACTEWSRSVVYMTTARHHALDKALHIAGLAQCPVRLIPMDQDMRMDVSALRRQILQDRESGLSPWLIGATAGTINTGAIDPISELTKVRDDEDLWLHIDGAYGGFFRLVMPEHPDMRALSQADSLVLDPHKGLFLSYGCGAVIVRQGNLLRQGLQYSSDYMADLTTDQPNPTDYSPELTRHFRSLRLWMTIRVFGLAKLKEALREKLLLAQYAFRALETNLHLEMGPVPQLSCVTFRMRAGDEATTALLQRIRETGTVLLSSTRFDDQMYLRMCILSFRSHRHEVDLAVDEIRRHASTVVN